jgi:hypothetical protein
MIVSDLEEFSGLLVQIIISIESWKFIGGIFKGHERRGRQFLKTLGKQYVCFIQKSPEAIPVIYFVCAALANIMNLCSASCKLNENWVDCFQTKEQAQEIRQPICQNRESNDLFEVFLAVSTSTKPRVLNMLHFGIETKVLSIFSPRASGWSLWKSTLTRRPPPSVIVRRIPAFRSTCRAATEEQQEREEIPQGRSLATKITKLYRHQLQTHHQHRKLLIPCQDYKLKKPGSGPSPDPVALQDSTSKFDMLPFIILQFPVNLASFQKDIEPFLLFRFYCGPRETGYLLSIVCLITRPCYPGSIASPSAL